MSAPQTLRPRAPLLARLVRTARPLYRVLAGLACVLVLLTVFSSAGPTGGGSSSATGRSFRMPTYFNRLYALGGSTRAAKIVHPIPAKIKAAEAKFTKMIAGQSRSLAQAVAEYKRRYGRLPPKGFDDWYAFATANGAVIIDEYDQLMDDLRPFWLLSGAEIRRRSLDVGLLPSVALVQIENGKTRTVNANTGFDDAEGGARAKGFRVMLEKFQGEHNQLSKDLCLHWSGNADRPCSPAPDKLPDMYFPINEKAEGRILVPWEQSKFSNLTAGEATRTSPRRSVECRPPTRGEC
jgi:hypothetical protein